MICARTGLLSLSPLLLVLLGAQRSEPLVDRRSPGAADGRLAGTAAELRAPGAELVDEADPRDPELRVRHGAERAFGVDACPSDIVVDLWPPNHKYVDVDLAPLLGPTTTGIQITAITQDEPVDDHGDGHTVCDGSGIGTSIAHIRSERSGQRDGRVYEIAYSALGGACAGIVTVTVPHDQSGADAVDSGQLFDSTEGCP